jgi:hypothetical protein
MLSALVSAQDHIKEDNDIDYHSRENVETVETGDKEKEVGEQTGSILITDQVGPFDNIPGILQFF